MGPTEKSSSMTIPAYNSDSSVVDNFNTEMALSEDWGIVRKTRLSPETLDTQMDLLKWTVSTVQILSRLHLPPGIVHYRRCWFEGSLSERYNAVFAIIPTPTPIISPSSSSESEDDENSTFLCLLMERVNQVTLEDWLNDRAGNFLYESQITCIISQLLSALKFLLEHDISLFHGISCSNIYVVQEDNCFATELSPKLKLDCLSLEKLSSLESNDKSDENSTDLKNGFEFVSCLYLQLLRSNCLASKDLELVYPEEFKILKDLKQEKMTVFAMTPILAKLESLSEKYSSNILLNVHEASRSFVGRQCEMNLLMEVITGDKNPSNNLIVIHGPSGAGKSEMICQLTRALLSRKGNLSENDNINIFCFNASSVDTLTRSIHACANHSKLELSTKDYIAKPKLLKDIFQTILLAFSDSATLFIFENADSSSEEMVDLLTTFKEHTKCEVSSSSPRSKQFLILAMKKFWTNSSLWEESTMIQLSSLNPSDSITLLLRNNLQLEGESGEIQELAEMLQNTPAALQLTVSYAKHAALTSFKKLLTTFHQFTEKFPQLNDNIINSQPYLQPTCLIYSMSLQFCYESFSEVKRHLADKVLSLLQYVDGESGISPQFLFEVLQNLPKPQPKPAMDELKAMLNTLCNLSLICYIDGIIRLPSWMQQALKKSLQLLHKTDNPSTDKTYRLELLLALQNILCSTKVEWSFKVSDVLPHSMRIWMELAGNDPILAKQFDNMPELILKLAKDCDKFEEVAGFSKQAGDIISLAHNSPHHMQILKLKFHLGVESLLPKSKMNEAFTIFKTIQEQSRTEPREFLMLKLKSLIELGKIHIVRQEYPKAISCFQQVQIFAAQKISTIELDSEPTLLNARMMHGYVHFLQSNFVEGKKILLQVVPLLERYAGPELKQVRMFLLQAKFYLACLLRNSGDLVNALMIQTKLLEERERIFGQKHPDTWSSKQEMALLYSSYDNHDKALILLRELLETQEEVLGAPSNRQSLATMNAIAEIELKLGNFDDALELYEAIDLIEQEVLEDQDEMRISTQLNQAEVLMSLGQYKEAVDIFDLVHTLRSTSDDKSSKNVQLCTDILEKREKAGRSMEILGNYWLSLTPENVDDPSELSALAKKHEVAIELTENQDNNGALRFLREVLEDSTHLEETNKFLLNIKADLARVLGLVGKFNESFSVYKEIIPLMDATFGETDELTMLCKDTMGQVFLFSGNQFLKRQMSNLKWFLF